MGLDFKFNIRSTGEQGYSREATLIQLSEIIKAIEDAVAPYGLGIYSMKQQRYIEFKIDRGPSNV